MNKRTRQRLIVVTGVIVIVLIAVLAYVGSGGASKAVTLAQAVSGEYANQRVQVSGTVVDDSYSNSNATLSFAIYDPEADNSQTLDVVFEGPVSATFGNGIVAICTGKLDENGVLRASELVTKCPSKYESAEGAVTAEYLQERGDQLVGQELKLAGYIKAGTLVGVGGPQRFVLYSQGGEVPVAFDGALSDEVRDEASVVVAGALDKNGVFQATDVALEEVG
ncbi:MAG: cytochrome c maturation protein CcmE [Coriobacteriales bacterium]|jgi:cytochrome c-type biogenesis protein CcmE|nr:cytochrome c maturation protein CcmE [Coriobacteriales bacterium]